MVILSTIIFCPTFFINTFMGFKGYLIEGLPELKVGDIIKVGKFKNKQVEIVGFGKNEKNQPTIKTKPVNGKGKEKERNLYSFNIERLMEGWWTVKDMPIKRKSKVIDREALEKRLDALEAEYHSLSSLEDVGEREYREQMISDEMQYIHDQLSS
jgi:hypothetical protein